MSTLAASFRNFRSKLMSYGDDNVYQSLLQQLRKETLFKEIYDPIWPDFKLV